MSFKKKLQNIVLLPLFVLGVVAAQLIHVVPAHAAGNTLTWTGAGTDTKFSTAANWDTNTAPTNGDALIFPWISGKSAVNVVNDSNLSYASVTLKNGAGTAASTSYYIDVGIKLSGSAVYTQDQTAGYSYAYLYQGTSSNGGTAPLLNVTGNLTISNVSLSTIATVTGDVTLNNASFTNIGSSVGGKVYVNASSVAAVAISASEFVLANGASLRSYSPSTNAITIPTPITVNGAASLTADAQCSYSSQDKTCNNTTYTLSGTLTLNADLKVTANDQQATIAFTGTVNKNEHSVVEGDYSAGVIKVGSETISTPTTQITISDSQPTNSLSVTTGQIVTLDGVRGNTFVSAKGQLKGVGTTTNLYNQGKVAPGHSPGTLTILDSYQQSGGVLETELLNKDVYDQLIVGKNHTSTTYAPVSLLDGSQLSVVLYPGWVVNKGDQFKIIDNQSNQAVQGSFAGLPEGTQFTVDGIVFNISYAGGDGNDVVLTALTAGKAAKTPNTGSAKVEFANPAIIAGVGLSAAVVIGLIALKRRSSK